MITNENYGIVANKSKSTYNDDILTKLKKISSQ